jgi:hypothetical protein
MGPPAERGGGGGGPVVRAAESSNNQGRACFRTCGCALPHQHGLKATHAPLAPKLTSQPALLWRVACSDREGATQRLHHACRSVWCVVCAVGGRRASRTSNLHRLASSGVQGKGRERVALVVCVGIRASLLCACSSDARRVAADAAERPGAQAL